MFHWKYTSSNWTDKGKADIEKGDLVQSHYRARWKGIVLVLYPDTGAALCLITIDRHNNPLRKPKKMRLHVDYLKLVERKGKHHV